MSNLAAISFSICTKKTFTPQGMKWSCAIQPREWNNHVLYNPGNKMIMCNTTQGTK
jgi:hypothetical protein